MKIALIGDMHSRTDFVHQLLQDEKPDFALQVGDYIAYNESWEVPLGWISGNWDNPKIIQTLENDDVVLPNNNFYLKAGELYTIYGKTIVTLPTFHNNKREHRSPAGVFPEHIEKCLRYQGREIDFFISHGCGYPFITKTQYGIKDVSEKAITKIIKALKPKYAISGHIHQDNYVIEENIHFYRIGYQKTVIINI